MVAFTKFQKIAIGLGAVSGAALYYLTSQNVNKKHVHASWTTNYTANVKWDSNWDHRSPKCLINPKYLEHHKGDDNAINEKLEKKKPRCVRHLILIRHGQYNLSGVNDGERFLTDLGREQAQSTGCRLKELALPYTEIVKSTMTRAQETGSLISQALPNVPVSHCELLREGAPIPPEPPMGNWKPEAHFYEDGARIEAAFRKYFHRADPHEEKDSYMILVCHANVIRYFVCRALQFPPEAWLRLSLNHGSITWLSITPSGRVVLRQLGDTGHMPPKMLTSR